MIKKIFFSFLLTFSFLFAIILTILSTIGIETDRFNRIIINQVEQRKNVRLNLKTIDFKDNIYAKLMYLKFILGFIPKIL